MSSIAIIVFTVLLTTGALFLYNKFGRQKEYYKKIIDTSTNIVMLSNEKYIFEVNRTFFQYFSSYSTVEEFVQEHKCICEFFQEEDGCLSAITKNVEWIKELSLHEESKRKVKLLIEGEVYYFLVSASLVDEEHSYYAVILSDITEQEKTKKELERLIINDPLTNIGNRRFFDDRLHEHLVLSQRYNHPFSLVLFDIDYFKKINDKHGHDVGDKVLVEYTQLIESRLREGDMFARIGGEEFVILLPYTTKDKAYTFAEKLRQFIESSQKITPITMSFGVVEYVKGDDEKSIFKRADLALYKAKDSGRNKVVLG